jgi:hypothetical protein
VQRSLQGGWSWAALGAAVLATSALVVVLLVVRLPQLMDLDEPLTAGYAKALVGGYALAVGAIALLAATLPRRLLWLPVAGACALAGLSLLATLTVGREAWSFAVALLTMGACWRAGNWALLRLRVPSVASAPPAAWLAGAGLLGLALYLAGRLGALRWWTVALPVIALGLTAAPPALRALRRLPEVRERLTRTGAAAASIIALLLGLASIFAAAPELMFDALSSKAWLPAEWARSGSIGSLSEHPQLNLIGFAPVLAIPGHLVDAGGVGRYVQWLSLAAVVGSVWWLARRSPWAPVAAAAVAITPHLFWQATTAYDDAALTLAGVGLAAAFVRLVREPGGAPLAAGVAAGLLAGAAVDLKLHLAPLAAGLVLAWLVFGVGAGRLRAGAGAIAGGLALAGPPFAIKWIELGNPLLPNYNGVFRSEYWPVSDRGATFPASYAGGAAGESPLAELAEPIELLLRTATDTGRMSQAAPDGSFGLITAATLVAALLLWSRGRGAREVLVLWGGLAVAAVVWYFQFRYLRFILPAGAVAMAALALATPDRRLGPWLERGTVAALAACAALMWVPTVAQFWNVPGRDLPVEAAFGAQDDYDYERTSMPERDAVAAFDRLAPPGAMVMSPTQQRLWLTEGRDISPHWEVARRLRSASAPPASDPALVRYRKLGVEWILGMRSGVPFAERGVPELLDQSGEIAWADRDWILVRLADRPRAPAPIGCDDLLAGRPGCWEGTLDRRPGFTVEETPAVARSFPICAGRTLVVDVTVRGTGPPVAVEIDFDFPPRPRPLLRVRQELALGRGGTTRIPATAPPGTRTGARVTVFGTAGRTVEAVRLGTLGRCRTDLPGAR